MTGGNVGDQGTRLALQALLEISAVIEETLHDKRHHVIKIRILAWRARRQ